MAEIKDVVSKDTWEVIKDNYEKGSYTTAITNLIQYINEVIQDKANLENVDNTSLIEQAFFTKPPKLAITKLQTRTEKDIQEGIGHILKGICLAIRNPRSHKRFNDDKQTAITIILFCDYILSFVRKSQQPNLIDDWLDFVFDENFVDTEEYSKETLKLIPDKKKYDLLVSIFRERERNSGRKLNYLVNGLLDSITQTQYQEFVDGINKELISSGNDIKLRNFFKLFPPEKWDDITTLSKLRVENIVKESITDVKVSYEEDEWGNWQPCDFVEEELLSVYALDFIEFFSTKQDVINEINVNAKKDDTLKELYFEKYFSKYLVSSQSSDVLDVSDEDLPF